MADKKVTELENEQSYESSYNDIPPSDIVAFNELRSCADLLRLYTTGQLDIQPDFQREVVWSKPDQTRFIDSLTKQLPIPSMCISLDYKTEKRLVIDGLQRMTSIIYFLTRDDWKLSDLDDIDYRLAKNTVQTIKNKYKDIYDRVQNVTIPVTVIRCDNSKKSHNEYLFTIFKRLNSGGAKLNNQEIRNCVYNGSFNSVLKTVAKSPESKKIFGVKRRFGSEEMVLRFFAFYDRLTTYDGKLSKFLNDYMDDQKSSTPSEIEKKKSFYLDVCKFTHEKLFNKMATSSNGKTYMEGVLYGVAKNYEALKKAESKKLKSLLKQFNNLEEFSIESLQEGLSGKDKVKDRLNAAKKCFAS